MIVPNSTRHLLVNVVHSARVSQWIKNVFVMAPLLFSGKLLDVDLIVNTLIVFFAFCLISSGTYLINDVVDFRRDQCHSYKKFRPIASGQLQRRFALVIAILMWLWGIGLSLIGDNPNQVAYILIAYVVLNLIYSLVLKHVAIMDITCIAIGFLLRVVAGAATISVTPSIWILITTFLLALFLATGKRQSEYMSMQDGGTIYRPVLSKYSQRGLNLGLKVLALATVTAFIGFSISKFSQYPAFILLVVLVVVGLHRYIHAVNVDQSGLDPLSIIIKDVRILVAGALWLLGAIVIIYG